MQICFFEKSKYIHGLELSKNNLKKMRLVRPSFKLRDYLEMSLLHTYLAVFSIQNSVFDILSTTISRIYKQNARLAEGSEFQIYMWLFPRGGQNSQKQSYSIVASYQNKTSFVLFHFHQHLLYSKCYTAIKQIHSTPALTKLSNTANKNIILQHQPPFQTQPLQVKCIYSWKDLNQISLRKDLLLKECKTRNVKFRSFTFSL